MLDDQKNKNSTVLVMENLRIFYVIAVLLKSKRPYFFLQLRDKSEIGFCFILYTTKADPINALINSAYVTTMCKPIIDPTNDLINVHLLYYISHSQSCKIF